MRTRLVSVVVFLFAAAGLFGQSLASLNGTVADPSGALVPAASLTLTNLETAARLNTVTDSAGRYNYPQLPPGKYKLSVKAAGFAETIVNNLQLLVNSPATVNVTFEKVGAVSEVVSVIAEAAQVNTVDATLGNAIGAQAITELPFYARNVPDLLKFQPGVTSDGQVNGGKSDQAHVTLDGVDVDNQNSRAAFTSVLRVTLDSVQEFRTTTTNANADQGRSSGAQIALITRSGSNSLHGSLYEYRRGTETAANDFFLNQSGLPKPVLLINVFGGRAGGPIKKNRLFYFLNYEGRRDASAAQPTTPRTVPSDLMRQGILQYPATGGGVKQVTPADFKTLDPAGIGLNQASLQALNLYPHANDTTAGDGYNILGYRFSAPQRSDQNTYIVKFDWNAAESGKHQVFLRGNLQNDSKNGLPQFPGQPPASVTLDNSKGLATGYTSILKQNLVSTTRYGFTRQGGETTGVITSPYTIFRGISTLYATTTGTARIVPVHNITQDFAWTHGAHDVRIGGVLRWISNQSSSTSNTLHNASTNSAWLFGTGQQLQPADLSSGFRSSYNLASVVMLGLVPQVNSVYNYQVDGKVLAPGSPIPRKFNNEEYEWYIQDTWRVTRALTVTAGLRHSLMPPIYEANGQQLSTDVSIGQWFYQRANLGSVGAPQSIAPKISFIPANGPGGRELYEFHKKNLAPRLSLAYSPQGSSGLSKFFFGGAGRSSIRAGWGMFYDLFGQPLAQTYSATGSFGLSTTLTNPAGVQTIQSAPRFTGFYSVPPALLAPPPPATFPKVYPDAFAITNAIDDTIKAPYTMNMNFSISREFGHGLFIQGAYVGRLSRRSLIQKDLAMPTNLVDPKSGQTYFEAASQIAAMAMNKVPVAQVPKVPFWENLWPAAATSTLTATQVMFNKYASFAPDYTSALLDIDVAPCKPACSIYGPYAIFNSQFSSLGAQSSQGRGNYHAMQWTVRKRFGEGLLMDFNYTWSKSLDLASVNENAARFSGFLLNPWFSRQRWAVSDYDSTHIVNAYAVWQVPVGKNRTFLTGANRFVDAFVGGWQISPTWSQASGQPTGVGNGLNFPTNWEISGSATPIGPVTTSPNRNTAASNGTSGPNLFADPKAAFALYSFTLPGQSGGRNQLRSWGTFVINLGVAKSFTLFNLHDNPHKLQFRWESFNLTNTATFSSPSLSLNTVGTFGKYTAASDPRQMQFALRYEF